MANKIIRALILGPPGSGKGTLSNRILKDFQFKYLSAGDVLRSHVHDKTEYGLKAMTFISQGHLVPDNLVSALINAEIKKMGNSSWLLDGYPRTVNQAKDLDKHESVDVVLNIDVPFPIIIDRIKNRLTHPASGRIYNLEFNPPKIAGKDDITGEPLVQREDDKPETVSVRLDNYQKETAPVLNYYKERNILMNFRGNYSNEIWPHLHKHLSTLTTPLQYTEYK